MTPLQLALTSEIQMDLYLEEYGSEQIIKDILAYSNADRTVIATAAMQGILSNSSDWNEDQINVDWVSRNSVKYADALIAELNKQS